MERQRGLIHIEDPVDEYSFYNSMLFSHTRYNVSVKAHILYLLSKCCSSLNTLRTPGLKNGRARKSFNGIPLRAFSARGLPAGNGCYPWNRN